MLFVSERIKHRNGLLIIIFLFTCMFLNINILTFPQVSLCNDKPINKEEGETLRHTANGLLAKVSSGDHAAYNLSQLRNLLCEAKGRPVSITFQYILLDYAEARIKVGEQREAAIMLANEASELPVYWIEPSLLEKMTLLVFRYGDKEAKSRMKGIYHSASDFGLYWISLKLKTGKQITNTDLSELESNLGFYSALWLPLRFLSGKKVKRYSFGSKEVIEMEKQRREVLVLGLYKKALASRYGNYWVGYFVREGYKVLIFLLIILLLARAGIRLRKTFRKVSGKSVNQYAL